MNLYRYEAKKYATADADGEYSLPRLPNPKLELTTFVMVSATPKGYWIAYPNFEGFSDWKRWVSKTARKRFAYPTKEEALNGFIARTRARIRILDRQLACAHLSLHDAEALIAKIKNP
jgi:hypothetical protein